GRCGRRSTSTSSAPPPTAPRSSPSRATSTTCSPAACAPTRNCRRAGASCSASVAISHHVDLSATFAYQYFLPFNVTNSVQQPTTNGTYNDMREILLVDVEVHGWR